MKELHSSSLEGHSGITATYHRVKQKIYWPRLKEEVHQFVQNCENCQLNKVEHTSSPGLLQHFPVPEEAWSSVGMDFITRLPKSKGYVVIMVVVDRLTKYGHFTPLNHPYSATTVAQAFMDTVYKLHGLPLSIVSDRDPIFTSRFWQELMKKLEVKLNMSTSYHQQSDGQTEKVNQCLEHYLRSMVCEKQNCWVNYLTLAEWWYNLTWHSAIKLTPFEALYGYASPQLSLASAPKSQVMSVNSFLKDRHAVLTRLKSNLRKAQERMKKNANKNRSERKFEVGDWVYLKLQPYRKISIAGKKNQKLSSRYYGPFKVIQRIENVAYKLNLPPNSLIHHVFHASQLKKKLGDAQTLSLTVLVIGPEVADKLTPMLILARRIIKKRNEPLVQVLVQ